NGGGSSLGQTPTTFAGLAIVQSGSGFSTLVQPVKGSVSIKIAMSDLVIVLLEGIGVSLLTLLFDLSAAQKRRGREDEGDEPARQLDLEGGHVRRPSPSARRVVVVGGRLDLVGIDASIEHDPEVTQHCYDLVLDLVLAAGELHQKARRMLDDVAQRH